MKGSRRKCGRKEVSEILSERRKKDIVEKCLCFNKTNEQIKKTWDKEKKLIK